MENSTGCQTREFQSPPSTPSSSFKHNEHDLAYLTLVAETKARRVELRSQPSGLKGIYPPSRSDGVPTSIIRRRSHKNLRRKLWQRDSDGTSAKCHWCPKILCVVTFTMDHVIALGEDGAHDLSNLVIACKECNGRRCSEQNTRQVNRLRQTQKAAAVPFINKPPVQPKKPAIPPSSKAKKKKEQSRLTRVMYEALAKHPERTELQEWKKRHEDEIERSILDKRTKRMRA